MNKNKVKKILSIIILAVILIGISNLSNASFTIDEAALYSKGEYVNLLKYNGIEVLTTFVVYSNGGVEYPAYCIERENPGVTESHPYTVSVEGALNNSLVWRAITNGYPYKTASQLGCSNNVEAFVATKQAVYCVLYGNDYNNFERYEAIGTAGQRTLNALKQIVTAARNGSSSKPSSNITMTAENNNWTVDSKNKDYVSKTYTAISGGAISKYTIILDGQVPEDTIITDINNKEKSSFTGGDKFKVLIPIKNLKKNGNFNINATAEVNTTPVLYGKSPIEIDQDYALTGSKIEIGNGKITTNYTLNNTKITINKVDKDTKNPIEGTEFKVMDSNKKDVYSGLVTDKNGKIVLNNLLPGKYYIEETKALNGYTVYKGLIEVDLELNEEFTVTVNNSKENITTVETSKGSLVVSQGEKSVSVTDKSSSSVIIDDKTVASASSSSTSSTSSSNSADSSSSSGSAASAASDASSSSSSDASSASASSSSADSSASSAAASSASSDAVSGSGSVSASSSSSSASVIKLPKAGM